MSLLRGIPGKGHPRGTGEDQVFGPLVRLGVRHSVHSLNVFGFYFEIGRIAIRPYNCWKVFMKRPWVLGIILVVVVMAVFAAAIIINISDLLRSEIIGADLALLPDGIYGGSYSYIGITCRVHVTVKDHKIAAIEVDESRKSDYLDRAKFVTKRVIKEQSLDVDTVTTATFTSRAILKAIENALTNGQGKQEAR